MTNPDDMVRVRARNGGRASVYEANAWAQGFASGLLEGNGVTQNTSADMNVLVGGSTTKPDVVIAENPAGYKIVLDIVSQEAVTLTAPASNSRITAIVAYTDDLSLSSSETEVTGSPASCGLLAVSGRAAASPSAPTDAQIRAAITQDGATGSQAAYAVIATITIDSSTTMIDDSMISMNIATLAPTNMSSLVSTDTNSWTKIEVSNEMVIYLKRGTTSKTQSASSWDSFTASTKPVDLSTSHTFFGGAGGSASDKAMNVCGYIIPGSGAVSIQHQNIHTGSVSTTISWWAWIVEILS